MGFFKQGIAVFPKTEAHAVQESPKRQALSGVPSGLYLSKVNKDWRVLHILSRSRNRALASRQAGVLQALEKSKRTNNKRKNYIHQKDAKKMNILVTLDTNYIARLRVMLWSLFFSNQGKSFHIYLMHSSIAAEDLDALDKFVRENGHKLSVIEIDRGYFAAYPVTAQYPQEMYYRLMAYHFLPHELDKILYLDPDILVINSVSELYDTDMEGVFYAAAYHNKVSVNELNKLRLSAYEVGKYFNSGVLLMNLTLQREKIRENSIFEFVENYKGHLFLPDQDILNALYSKDIMPIDEIIYNYDTRYYQYNKRASDGAIDMDYIMRNTVFLHFCGKKKPWSEKNYRGKFLALYKHYEILSQRANVPYMAPAQNSAPPLETYITVGTVTENQPAQRKIGQK